MNDPSAKAILVSAALSVGCSPPSTNQHDVTPVQVQWSGSGVAQSPAHRPSPPCNVGSENSEAIEVTIRQVLQAPADFDGRVVRLKGFVALPFEGTAVYETPADFEHRRRWRSVFLTLNPHLTAQGARLGCDGVEAIVEGKFNGFENGNFGLFPAELEPVTRIVGISVR